MVRMRLATIVAGIAGAIAVVSAADLPYAGKWALDSAASKFQGSTMTFTQLPSGEWTLAAIGESYTFRIDGKEHPAFFESAATWKQVDPNTWEATYTGGGRRLWTDRYVLSADGKSLTVTSTVYKPDGSTNQDVVTFDRMSGGPGLAGKFKSTKANVTSAGTLEIAARGENGLTIRMVDYGGLAEPEFDGKDYPLSGPFAPPGSTIAIEKTGPRGFKMTQKIKGKAVWAVAYTVSQDGKTLTESGAPVATPDEKWTAIYRRK